MARSHCDTPLGFLGGGARCVIPRLGFQSLPIPRSQVGQLCLSTASPETPYFGNMSPTLPIVKDEVNVIMRLMVKNCQ